MPDLPPADRLPDVQNAAGQAQELFADVGLPAEFLEQVLMLSKQFGPEVLTAVAGWLSIYLINRGSTRYGDVREDMSDDEKRGVRRDASGQIMAGTVGMTAIAFAAANPLFAYPEMVAFIGSLKAHVDQRWPQLETMLQKIRADLLIKLSAIGVGIGTAAAYAEHPMQALPPIGLSALSVAFSGNLREETYRSLTLFGGSSLVLGSAYSTVEQFSQNNTVGGIMSLVFFALNTLFTRNELEAVEKKGGIGVLASKVYTKIKGLIGL